MQHPQKVKKVSNNKPPKRERRLLYLGITLALALVFVLLLPQIKLLYPSAKNPKVEKQLTFQTLQQMDKSALEKITVSPAEGDSYTLLYQAGGLQVQRQGQDDLPVQQSLADKIISAATTISVEEIVAKDVAEVREHLGDMGLEPPQISVTVHYKDGHEDVLQLGWRAPETAYYYYRWSGDKGVYLCDEGIYEAFEYTAHMLLPVEQMEMEKTLIDWMELHLLGQETLEMTFAMDQKGNVSGTLRKPFAYPLDADHVNALLEAAASFRLGAKRPDITVQNAGQFGFDNPLATIVAHQQEGYYGKVDENGVLVPQQAPEKTLAFVLGKKNGEYRYTCEYGGEYYDVSSLLVAAFLKGSVEEVVSQNPADMGTATVASIQIQMEGRVLDLRRTKTERVLGNNQLATDADGNLLYDVQVTLNGESAPEETFDALVRRLQIMRVSGRADKEFVLPASAPRWQATLTTEGGATRTIAAYPKDEFFDAIAIDGVVKHYLQAEAIDMALADLLPAL